MVSDPVTEDFQKFLGAEFDALSSAEQRSRVEAEVQFQRFKPPNIPDVAVSHCYNPAVSGYKEAGLHWDDHGWAPIDNTTPCGTYPEYVPTDAAIETLVELGPIVEVGAGDGYWAHTINENGGDCLPTDIHPDSVDPSSYPTTVSYGEDDSEEYTVWMAVKELDGVEAVQSHSDRAVLMCHPSGATRWSERVLDAIAGQPFVFIGEWYPGADATPQFFKTLAEEWRLTATFPVYDWASMHAHGYVFECE